MPGEFLDRIADPIACLEADLAFGGRRIDGDGIPDRVAGEARFGVGAKLDFEIRVALANGLEDLVEGQSLRGRHVVDAPRRLFGQHGGDIGGRAVASIDKGIDALPKQQRVVDHSRFVANGGFDQHAQQARGERCCRSLPGAEHGGVSQRHDVHIVVGAVHVGHAFRHHLGQRIDRRRRRLDDVGTRLCNSCYEPASRAVQDGGRTHDVDLDAALGIGAAGRGHQRGCVHHPLDRIGLEQRLDGGPVGHVDGGDRYRLGIKDRLHRLHVRCNVEQDDAVSALVQQPRGMAADDAGSGDENVHRLLPLRPPRRAYVAATLTRIAPMRRAAHARCARCTRAALTRNPGDGHA